MRSLAQTLSMTERHERGLLDTSVLVALETIAETSLPVRAAVAAITLAELAAGVHLARDAGERGARLARLQATEAAFEGLPFDVATARSYGHLVALVVAAGQSPRPRRMDLMIASTAHANGLPLYTMNPKDFRAVESAVTVVVVA
jgi:predicted nucleic acid-binding protein